MVGPVSVVLGKFSLMDPDVLIAVGSLAAALLVGAFAVAMIDRWRKRQANETFSTHDQLASFRLLYERGELSQEEFERVRQQLLARLKKQEAAGAARPLDELPEAPAELPKPEDPPAPPAPAP